MASCSFEAERAFGPAVRECRRSFDFTVTFEDVFFSLLPAAVFIAASAVQGVGLAWQRRTWQRRNVSALEWAALAAYAVLRLVVLVLLASQPRAAHTTTSLPAAALSLLASLVVILLSAFASRHLYLLVGLYLAITLLLEAAATRTHWLLDDEHAVAATGLASLLVQGILLAVLEWNGAYRQAMHVRPLANEEAAGFCSRSILGWLNSLLYTGYRRPLTEDDIRPVDSAIVSSRVSSDFRRLITAESPTSCRLLYISLRSLGFYAFSPVIPRLCQTGFTFAQPFLATSLISYLSDSQSKKGAGYGLIGASLLAYGGIAISTGWYWNLTYKCVTKVRGAHVDVISQKVMKLPQKDGVESKAMTLMISDVQRIVGALSFVHEFWASPLETALATWLLWRQVGPSALTVLGVALVCTFGSTFISKQVGAQQQIWLKATEKRISATNKMLASLKAIKMTGADIQVAAVIERLRGLEFAASKLYRTLLVGTVFVSYSTLTLAPVIVFGAYVGATRSRTENFDATRLFGSLILINLLASPLIRLLQIIPQFGAAFGCLTRLADFLTREELVASPKTRSAGIEPESGQVDGETALPERLEVSEKSLSTARHTEEAIIKIQDADLGWGPTALLKDVNFEVFEAESIAITGAVGTGKTLLMHTMLGEVPALRGRLFLHKTIPVAYCSQIPWLENLSAYENAFRCAPDDPVWRQKVIDACAIAPVLESHGQETIGSGGSKLSGGEKQRLALARAVASRPSLLLLDDALNAIDRSTKQNIMDNLLGGDGLLRRLSTTIIQVTQDDNLIARADRAFRVEENVLSEFVSTVPPSSQQDHHDIFKADPLEKNELRDTPNSATNPPKQAGKANGVTNVSDTAVYRTYFKSIGTLQMLIFLVCGIAFVFTFKFPDVWAKWWANASPGSGIENVGYWLGLYAVLSILPLFTVAIWLSHLMHKIVPTTGLELHRKLLTTVLGATFPFIAGVDSGSLINRFNQDLMFIDSRLPLSLLNTISGLLVCIVQIVLVVAPAIYILATLPVVGIVLWVLQHFYLRTSKQLRHLELQSKAGLHTKLSETYEGLPTIRAHGWQYVMREEFHEKLDRTQEPFYLLYLVQTWLQLVLNFLVAGLSVTVVGVAVALRHTSSASGIGLAILNLVNLGQSLTNFITPWTTLETSLGAIARIEAFEADTPQESDVAEPVEVPAQWPSQGELIFQNVWTSYSDRGDVSHWALQDISLRIRAGERIAICGQTGSGKSTLMLSILALVRSSKGTIMLDGVDLSKVSQLTLRSRLLVIPQDPYVEGDTVRAAVDPEHTASDETLMSVLRDCGLWEKVDAVGGLESPFTGLNLSVGQTQLLILARTIVEARDKKGGLLLLDEATSSIDVATEQRIMACIRERLPGKTVTSILHRLEAALEFDRIVVLEKGKIVSMGTPEEVIRDSELFSSFRKTS